MSCERSRPFSGSSLNVAAFTIPTDAPEADGTLSWDATTIVVVHAHAPGATGLGYTYADVSTAKLIETKLRAVVDSGATRLVLPKSVVQKLGLKETGKIGVTYADGRRATRPVVDNVHLELQGRSSIFKASIEPGRDSALIGAIVLLVPVLAGCEAGDNAPTLAQLKALIANFRGWYQ